MVWCPVHREILGIEEDSKVRHIQRLKHSYLDLPVAVYVSCLAHGLTFCFLGLLKLGGRLTRLENLKTDRRRRDYPARLSFVLRASRGGRSSRRLEI
jgi:hypothetical protein